MDLRIEFILSLIYYYRIKEIAQCSICMQVIVQNHLQFSLKHIYKNIYFNKNIFKIYVF